MTETEAERKRNGSGTEVEEEIFFPGPQKGLTKAPVSCIIFCVPFSCGHRGNGIL